MIIRLSNQIKSKNLIATIDYIISGIVKPCTLINPAPSKCTKLHLPPPTSIHLHPALCNTLNNISTKILLVIGQFPKFRPENSKLARIVSWKWWFLIQLDFWNSNPINLFLGTFVLKLLSVLSQYWHAWYFRAADSESGHRFSKF